MRGRSRRGVFARRSVDVPRPDAQGVYSLGPRLTDDVPLDGKIIVPLLLALPAMKRVWLDGVMLDRDQIAALEARFESVRIT